MKFINQSLNKRISEILGKCSSIKIASSSDQESIHKILNKSPMEIGKLNLKYSRLPDLYESYRESGLSPIIFVDKEIKNFSASFSELECYNKSKKQIFYYSSDLRSTKETPIQLRKEFRSSYSSVISSLKEDEICFTAVLTDNKRALNALTKKSSFFNYNPLFDYTSITTIASPIDLFISSKRSIKITEVLCNTTRSARDEYIKKQIKSSTFSHKVLTNESRNGQRDFLIFKNNEIVSYFSTYIPKNRKLLIDSSNRFLDKFISVISKGRKTLDWIYITNFVPKRENELFIKDIKKFLKKSKISKTFNLILLSTSSKEIDVPFFTVKTNARMFRVEKEQQERLVQGRFYLNPLCL